MNEIIFKYNIKEKFMDLYILCYTKINLSTEYYLNIDDIIMPTL